MSTPRPPNDPAQHAGSGEAEPAAGSSEAEPAADKRPAHASPAQIWAIATIVAVLYASVVAVAVQTVSYEELLIVLGVPWILVTAAIVVTSGSSVRVRRLVLTGVGLLSFIVVAIAGLAGLSEQGSPYLLAGFLFVTYGAAAMAAWWGDARLVHLYLSRRGCCASLRCSSPSCSTSDRCPIRSR